MEEKLNTKIPHLWRTQLLHNFVDSELSFPAVFKSNLLAVKVNVTKSKPVPDFLFLGRTLFNLG